MAISKMKKLTLAVVNNLRDQLLKELQALGSVHIDSLTNDESSEDQVVESAWHEGLDIVSLDVSVLEDQRKEISNAISKITDLFGIVPPSFEITTSHTIQQISHKYDIAALTGQLNVLDRQTKENEMLISNATAELEQVQRWSVGIDDMGPIHGTSSVVRGVAGHISESVFNSMLVSLIDVTDLADVVTCRVQDKEVYCFVVADISVWEEVNTVLREYGFNTIQITRRAGLMDDIVVELKSEIKHAQNQYNLAVKEWEYFSTKLTDLALLHDVLEIQIQQLKAGSLALSSEKVSFFRAWVPEDYMPKVEAILSIHHKSIDVTVEDPGEEEYASVPVLLKNNILTKPFSSLTMMYGTPMYGVTVDPTPHFSIFYFIFYGICLGDGIYGLLLLVFSSWMAFKNRINPVMFDFLSLLALCGLSSLISGIVFGSYAGDLFSTYFPVPALINLKYTFSDGLGFFDKPLFALFFSVLLGGIQLWYGYWIKFFVLLKNNMTEALFKELPWLILLGGFFGWAVFVWIASIAGLTFLSPSGVNALFLAMKIGAGLIILNNIRMGFQKGIVAGIFAPLAGAWELYSITGYLSNLLSYSRLLALGLSSGVMANVFNQLGFDMIAGLSAITPILGILGVIVLIGLHLFNFVLGGFGAFVHALRLQFVEFFGQFIEGGGKDFAPLVCKGTHYTVK